MFNSTSVSKAFKNTPLGLLPSEWSVCTVNSLGQIVTGKTPSTTRQDYFGGDILFVSPADIDEQRYIRQTQSTLTSKGAQQVHILPANTILVTCIGILGKVGQAATPLTTNQQINSIIPNEKIHPSYIFWAAHLLKHQLDIIAGMQVVPIVNKRLFSQLLLPCPPYSQQLRIGEVLDTLDLQIQESEKLIAKLKQMKIGLLHDLLTRGVDENGEVRGPVAHPEQFKESQLGRIPIGWTIGRLRDFYAEPARNGLYKAAKYYGKGNLMIHMQQMFRGLEVDISDAARVEVSVVEQERFKLKAGDLVFARRSLNLDGAGRCSLMPELTEPVTFESSIIRVRLSTAHLRPTFVNYFLNSDIGFRQRLPLIRQVAVSGVSSEDIASISVPCPPIEEQDAIINVSQTFDACISSEETNLNKLKQVKKGLMHDLLTGRVRVT